jgi:hypothetical protein
MQSTGRLYRSLRPCRADMPGKPQYQLQVPATWSSLRLRVPRSWRFAVCVAVAAAVTSCGGRSHTPATNQSAVATQLTDIDLPLQLAHFQRIDVLRRNDDHDVTAGYALGNGEEAVIATVRVRALSDAILPPLTSERVTDPSTSAQSLQASIAQVRHFYPDAALRDIRTVYLVKRGMLQGGRAATLRYEDMLAGQRQKIDLDIYMFCCVDRGKAYEFRIRHAADNNVGHLAVSFMQALSWSPGSDSDADR